MAWSLVHDANEATASSGNLSMSSSVTAPQIGDLQVAFISYRGTATFTPPASAGWSVIVQNSGGNDVNTPATSIASFMVAWRVISSAALITSPHVFTRTGGGAAIGHIQTWRSNAGTPLVDQFSSNVLGANATSATTGTITPTQDGALLMAFGALPDNDDYSACANATNPLTWTIRADDDTTSGNDVGMSTFTAVQTTAGATGTVTITGATSTRHGAFVASFIIEPKGILTVEGSSTVRFATETTDRAFIHSLIPAVGIVSSDYIFKNVILGDTYTNRTFFFTPLADLIQTLTDGHLTDVKVRPSPGDSLTTLDPILDTVSGWSIGSAYMNDTHRVLDEVRFTMSGGGGGVDVALVIWEIKDVDAESGEFISVTDYSGGVNTFPSGAHTVETNNLVIGQVFWNANDPITIDWNTGATTVTQSRRHPLSNDFMPALAPIGLDNIGVESAYFDGAGGSIDITAEITGTIVKGESFFVEFTYDPSTNFQDGDLASDGVATASFVGRSVASASFTIAGASTVAFVGASTARATTSAAGVATAAFVGGSIAEAILEADGVADASFIGEFDADTVVTGDFAIEGEATVAFVGAAVARASTTIAGVATAAFVGNGLASSIFSSTGVATATFLGNSIARAVLNSNGIGAFNAFISADKYAVFSADGVSAFDAVGDFIVTIFADFSMAAAATVNFEGRSTAEAILEANGIATGAFVSAALKLASFSMDGLATASFHGLGSESAPFLMEGTSTVEFVGASIFSGELTAAGLSSYVAIAGVHLLSEGVATVSFVGTVLSWTPEEIESDEWSAESSSDDGWTPEDQSSGSWN